MPMSASAVRMTTFAEEVKVGGSSNGASAPVAPAMMTSLAIRVWGEYKEMPGLRLTVRQAARLFSVAPEVADAVLDELRRASFLSRSADGAYFIDR